VEARIAMTILFFIMFFVGGGLSIIFPEAMYRVEANNTRNKKATKAIILRYRIGGTIFVLLGIVFMYALWTGKFKGL